MAKRQLMERLAAQYGEIPDVEYFDEDLRGIRMYYETRREMALDPFSLDDTTWHDLSMDAVFKRINAAQSTSGEQCLYYLLRTPAVEEETYQHRKALIDILAEKETLRLRIMAILHRLGKRRAANTRESFSPSKTSPGYLLLTILLVVIFLGCIVGLLFGLPLAVPLMISAMGNALYHALMIRRMEEELATINYSVGMVSACLRIRKLDDPILSPHLTQFFDAGHRARSIARTGGLTMATASDIATFINMVLLTDLITFWRLKQLLSRHRQDVFAIHETLGIIDASIAVGSWRKSAGTWCDPAIDFDPARKPFVAAQGLGHPLLSNPVPNDLNTSTPLLVTGSNASGKSTFLKAAAINAILAQSLCTAVCDTYEATSFRMYTSMAIADNILAGDSYFIAEIKSIKRIVDAAGRGERILCVIDEVLRGTNTVERVAASTELLGALQADNVLCLAATHDGELCLLLPDFRMVHFEEAIENGQVLFDYRLKEGPATTRNAIRLLEMLGFDPALTARSNARAERYLKTGVWTGESLENP